MTEQLFDRQGREVSYIRLSVTDRCDLRCQYCLPERPEFLPKAEVLSLEQLALIAKCFIELGVRKVRVTGGEPLSRRELPWLLTEIANQEGLQELTLTTNGTMLAAKAAELFAAGVDRINISLDTLQPTRFAQLTRNGDLRKVLRGIETAAKFGFKRLRINTVLMEDFNADELVDLVKYAQTVGADIAFIEEMPLGNLGREQYQDNLDGIKVLELLGEHFALAASSFTSNGPASYYSIANSATRVGIIAPHTRNFCTNCNRVRISCTGQLYPCLGHAHSTDLSAATRVGDASAIKSLIKEALAGKPDGHEFNWASSQGHVMRYMATTGG